MFPSRKPHRILPYFLLCISLSWLACGPVPSDGQTPPADEEPPPVQPIESDPERSAWPEYTNDTYGFSLSHPEDWTVLESATDQPFPLINVYPEAAASRADFPLDIHGPADVTYLAIFPRGFGTELPSGDQAALAQAPTIASEAGKRWNQETSRVFRLEDGSVWGLLLRPRQRPDSWSGDGYVFAQFRVDDFRTRCFSSGTNEEIPMRDCDPLTGDRIERYGTVADAARRRTLDILVSWRFETADQEPIGNLIRVERPLPNNGVSSPLRISGQARGYWYFEADFPVRLETYDGETLARGLAEAQGDWMTESFVPFRAELSFDAPDDERGYLVFERANPSGRPENERSFRLPVLFPPRSK